MTEGFYDYAVTKYKKTLDLLKFVKDYQHSEDSTASPDMLRKVSSITTLDYHYQSLIYKRIFQQLEISCHLSIANAFLEMQRDYGVALSHCNQVLKLDPDHAVCYFRMGQLLRVSHKWEKAITHLERADQLAQKSMSSQKFLVAISKELDKTRFDRGQHDAAYIRSQLEQRNTSKA